MQSLFGGAPDRLPRCYAAAAGDPHRAGTPRAGEYDPSTTTTRDPQPPSVNPSKPTARGAVAGSYLLGTLLLCAGLGAAVGALVGAPLALGLVGLFAGVPAGVVVVRRRFEDL